MADEMIRVHLTSEVFVAGGTPTETYNPRHGQKIERKIEQYLADTGKALTIHGASKSGKTSLVERMLPKDRAIWIQGQDVASVSSFWNQLGAHLGVGQSHTQTQTTEQSRTGTNAIGAGIPKVAHVDHSEMEGQTLGTTTASTSDTHVPNAVRDQLEHNKTPIVIDDFHFIPDRAKRSISRAIKTIVRSSPLILIAVPSEAFELVRAEPEMSGRVWSLPIPQWEESELAEIGSEGFKLLHLIDPGGSIAGQLAKYSYGSPFIMQQLCHDLVRWELDIVETCRTATSLGLPHDQARFLGDSADRSEPPLFTFLLAGAATKGTRRQVLHLAGSERTDIYGATLAAIKNLVPPMRHMQRNVYLEVQRITKEPVGAGQVHNALRQMHKIAEERRGVSDPVLRLRDNNLYVQDAMLAFYLKHGAWSPVK